MAAAAPAGRAEAAGGARWPPGARGGRRGSGGARGGGARWRRAVPAAAAVRGGSSRGAARGVSWSEEAAGDFLSTSAPRSVAPTYFFLATATSEYTLPASRTSTP